MTPTYLNWRGPCGRETVDEFTREPDQTWKEFRKYVRAMVAEYHMAGMAVYTSSRPCKGWTDDASAGDPT
jgi:hypothetical protein